MIIILPNKNLGVAIQALRNMHIQSMKVNRARARFLKRLIEKEKDFYNDGMELRKRHVKLVDGEPIMSDGRLVYLDGTNEYKYVEDINELENETVTIQGGEYSNNYKELFEYLLNSENVPLNGDESIVIDEILTQYEDQKEMIKDGK